MQEMLEGRAVSCRDRVDFVMRCGSDKATDLNIKSNFQWSTSFCGHSIKSEREKTNSSLALI